MTSASEGPPSSKRKWLAVILATVMMLFADLLFIFFLAAATSEEPAFAGGLLGIGLGLVPAVFLVAAFVSQNKNSLISSLAATAIWALLTVTIGLINLPVGLIAGFGAGGVVAFRRDEPHTWQSRAVAVGICVVYTFILQQIDAALGLFGAAALPFIAIMLADMYKERSVAAQA